MAMSVRILVGDEGKPPAGYASSLADHVDDVAIPGLVAMLRPTWETADVVRVSSALATMLTGWQSGETRDATVSGVTMRVVPAGM